MTTIRILERSALNITLFNSMCRQVGDSGDILKHFNLEAAGDESVAEVKILINGVEVDIVPELAGFIKMVDLQFEAAVEKRAKELVMNDRALLNLSEAIQNAEWAIQDRINKLMQTID